jgi:hypothetical protein
MGDRSFSEVELRRMLKRAKRYRQDIVEGRWVVEAPHRRRTWDVIVEPDDAAKLLVVITAYPVDEENA